MLNIAIENNAAFRPKPEVPHLRCCSLDPALSFNQPQRVRMVRDIG